MIRRYSPKRLTRRRRERPHDTWEPTDYDFPDDFEIESWMIGLATQEAKTE